MKSRDRLSGQASLADSVLAACIILSLAHLLWFCVHSFYAQTRLFLFSGHVPPGLKTMGLKTMVWLSISSFLKNFHLAFVKFQTVFI